MDTINTLDIKSFVSNTIKDVFETMFSMEVDLLDGEIQKANGDDRIVGSVGFAGDVLGSVNIHVSKAFGRTITASMLEMDVDEIDGDEEVHDVIGELCNMVGGDLKSRLCDTGLPCKLTIPSIACGNNFIVGPRGWTRKEQIALQHEAHTALVEVYIKLDE